MNEFQRIARAIDNGEPVVEALRRGVTASSGFESGTLMVFQQTTAPTGWTKETDHDDKAFRVVSGTAGSGGTKAFTTTFGSGKTTDSHTLTLTQMASHNHGSVSNHTHTVQYYNLFETNTNTGSIWNPSATDTTNADQVTTGAGGHTHSNNGGNGGHTHPLTNFDINYVDLIIASKD